MDVLISNQSKISMKIHVARKLKFWVDAEYECRRFRAPQSKTELFLRILLEWEAVGDAMRYVDHGARVSWKATPRFLESLHDAELDAKEEFERQYL